MSEKKPYEKPAVMDLAFNFTCLCGATASIARSDKGEPCVVHPLPQCKTFRETEDPTEFLAIVRRSGVNLDPRNKPS